MWKIMNLDVLNYIAPRDLKIGQTYLMYSTGDNFCRSRRIFRFKRHHVGMYFIVNIKDTYNVTEYHLPQYNRKKDLMFDFTGYKFYDFSEIYNLNTIVPSLSSLAFYQLSTAELEYANHNLCFNRRISSPR